MYGVEKNIVYITDENYAMPTAISIISLTANNTNQNRYHVSIFGSRLSGHTKKILESVGDEYVSCSVIDVIDGKYKELSQNCLTEGIHVSDTALYKFDIANILDSLDKVLYLDSDIIINQDIAELFDTELSDCYVAAADEMGDELIDGKSALAERIGIEGVHYFNSGVMLLNLTQLREEDVYRKLMEYRYSQTNYFMDQDAFNAVMCHRRKTVPYRYNFRTALFDVMMPEEIGEKFYGEKYLSVETCLSDQKIIHMSSQFKPWKYNIPWITELFEKYYRMSPYRSEPLALISSLKGLYDVYDPWRKNAIQLTREFDELVAKYRFSCQERSVKIWGFPYGEIKRGSRVVLYGAGDAGTDLYRQIMATDYCILVLWVDRNYREKAETVKAPEEILQTDFDSIIIAVTKREISETVKRYLKGIHVDSDKIVALSDGFQA